MIILQGNDPADIGPVPRHGDNSKVVRENWCIGFRSINHLNDAVDNLFGAQVGSQRNLDPGGLHDRLGSKLENPLFILIVGNSK